MLWLPGPEQTSSRSHPPPPGPHPAEQELLRLTDDSPVDLLCAPVPSCLPSPQLRPDPVVLQAADLIWFEEHPQEPSGGRRCVPGGLGSRGFSQTADTSRQDVNCVVDVGSHSTFAGTKIPVRITQTLLLSAFLQGWAHSLRCWRSSRPGHDSGLEGTATVLRQGAHGAARGGRLGCAPHFVKCSSSRGNPYLSPDMS